MSRRELLERLGTIGVASASAVLAACQAAAPAAPTTVPTPRPTSPPPQAVPPAVTPTEAPRPAAKVEAAPTTAPAAVTPAPAASPSGGTLVYALTREPDRLDPTTSALAPAQMVFFSIHDALIARAPDNTFQPWLAESWETSPDGKAYTFRLKRNVTFHDGTPFNAQAVKYTLDRVHDPNAKTRLSGPAYGFYEATETPDDHTAVVRLNRPWAPFLDALSYIYRIVSPAAGQQWGEDLGQHPVGTGPFVFKEWVPNSHVTLERFPNYNWAAPMFKHQGPAYLDAITFRQIPEGGARMAALERGDVQVVEGLPAQDVDRIKADPKYKVLVGLVQGRPYGYSINLRKPPTDDLAVRQAMEYAISQEAVARTVFGPYQSFGAMTPARSPLVPITWGYDKRAAEVYAYDPDKARQLLDGAGWTVGSGGVRAKHGQPLEIILGTWENGVAEVIQAQYRDVGIDLKIQIAPVVATNEAARREQVHMSPIPNARSDPDALSTNHSRNRGAGNEFTFHTNARLDDLFDAGATATNNDERSKIYGEIQTILMQDGMFLPVFHRDSVSAARAEVDGVIFDRGFFPLLYDASIRR